MKLSCKLFYVFIVLSFFASKAVAQNNYDQQYSVSALQEDFNFLRNKLEKKHPNLYLYTSKARFDIFLDSLYKTIVSPMTAQEYYQHISILNSKIKDGHTMFLPDNDAINYFNKNALFFPFYIAIINKRIFVKMNCSNADYLKEGIEILCINGKKTTDLLDELIARQIRDGENTTYPIWILNNYFTAYYSFSYGHPGKFSLVYSKDGFEVSQTINALSKDSILFYKKLRYPDKLTATNEGQGITLHVDKEKSIATLTIKSFDNSVLRSLYKQHFTPTITKIFEQIKNDGIQNLIVDLRDNQGGDFEPGKILLSYLLKQPISFLENSNIKETIFPNEKAFAGKLYVLINGGSFSNTAIVSSYLEQTKSAVFIGEETAGNKTIINGEPSDHILPNTKITAEISKRKYIIRNEFNDGHGVIPIHYIVPTIEDIIAGKDTVKDFANHLIATAKKVY